MTKEEIKKELKRIDKEGRKAEGVCVYGNDLALEILDAIRKLLRDMS